MKRINKRSQFEELRRFRNPKEFCDWWEQEEGRNWRLNSRHEHLRGLTEYWICSFRHDAKYVCISRLRIEKAYDGRYVIISVSKNRPHTHKVPEEKVGRSLFRAQNAI